MFTISQKARETIPEYRDTLMATLKQMEKDNELKVEEIRSIPGYYEGMQGSLFVLRVL